MNPIETKKNIELSLSGFGNNNLLDASKSLLNSIGYYSDKTLKLSPNNFSGFAQVFDITRNNFNKDKALVNEWNQIEIIFQLGDDDLTSQSALFDSKRVDNKIIESFLFVAIELKGTAYNRSTLAKVTRELNKLTSMPAIIIFKYNHLLTISIIDRRLHKREESKDVLEKVTLIKDILIPSPSESPLLDKERGRGEVNKPHRAHIEILFDLSFNELQKNHSITNFVSLHSAWQKTLDTKELNKKFYEKLFNWYLWALKHVKFPQIRPEKDMLKDEIHQSESLIRLLTRLLFVWFMKEKGLINLILFDCTKLQSVLKNFEGIGGEGTIYYKAILQNLFFATLNKPIEQRKVIDKGFNPKEYGDPLVYRYDELFQDSKNFIKLFENIPFLNGGLFECLDQRKEKDNPFEIRLDGFSTKKSKQPIVPDKLFFGEYKNIDLSEDYYDKKKSKQTVFGLIDILNQYKFTIEENTPVEEEIALDPELLGKVFENLLASYNPETKTTARKQTGSFYTPREIVNYMVDESIIAYLKNHIDDEERLRKLLSYNTSEIENPFNEKETLILLKAIDSCKILDPACGSGAFPMGILQKMIFVLHKLDPENKLWFDMVVENIPVYMREEFRKRLSKESWNYVRKLGIIQQCIYGVDIQPIATQIAKLRFFISLLVDQTEMPDEPNRGFEPLPNLDFKIVTANTLISAPASDVKTEGLFAEQTDPFFEQFDNLTEKYFNTSIEEEKKALRKQITDLINKKCNEKIAELEKSYASENEQVKKALKEKKKSFIEAKENEIKLWQSYTNLFKHESVGFFEPRYFFPKVKDGFDIVIGNPPYGAYFDNDTKVYLKKAFPIIQGQPESYEYFIFHSLNDLINNDGFCSYIVPTNFIESKRAEQLREYLLNNGQIKILSNFRFNVWENNAAETLIFGYHKNRNGKTKVLHPKNFDGFLRGEGIKFFDQKDWLNTPGKRFIIRSDISFLKFISENSKQLGELVDISQGIIVYKTKEDSSRNLYISKQKKNDQWKKLLDGKSKIEPYNIIWGGNYLHYGDWLWCSREEKYFTNPKILFIRLRNKSLTRKLIGAYDEQGFYNRDNFNNIIQKDKDCSLKFILALFNSKLSNYWYKAHFDNVNINPEQVRMIPIKGLDNQKSIISLIDKILTVKKQNPISDTSALENEIDIMVYKLYELTYEEVKIIDPAFALTEKEYADYKIE